MASADGKLKFSIWDTDSSLSDAPPDDEDMDQPVCRFTRRQTATMSAVIFHALPTTTAGASVKPVRDRPHENDVEHPSLGAISSQPSDGRNVVSAVPRVPLINVPTARAINNIEDTEQTAPRISFSQTLNNPEEIPNAVRNLEENTQDNVPALIDLHPDRVEGEHLLWLLSKRGGKFDIAHIAERLSRNISASDAGLSPSDLLSPEQFAERWNSVLNCRKTRALQERAQQSGRTYRDEFADFEQDEYVSSREHSPNHQARAANIPSAQGGSTTHLYGPQTAWRSPRIRDEMVNTWLQDVAVPISPMMTGSVLPYENLVWPSDTNIGEPCAVPGMLTSYDPTLLEAPDAPDFQCGIQMIYGRTLNESYATEPDNNFGHEVSSGLDNQLNLNQEMLDISPDNLRESDPAMRGVDTETSEFDWEKEFVNFD